MDAKALILVGMGPGNGRAIADRFAAEGYALGLIARSENRLRAQADSLRDKGITVEIAVADSTDLEALTGAIDTLARRLPAISVLIFNAYAHTERTATELDPARLLSDLTANVAAPLAAAQAVLPEMRQRGSGAILFTGGGLALYPSMYAASLSIGKSALRTLTLVLSEELRDGPVRVGTVTIAGAVGSEINATDVAEAFWQLTENDAGSSPEIVLSP